jgi:hypothetical protein
MPLINNLCELIKNQNMLGGCKSPKNNNLNKDNFDENSGMKQSQYNALVNSISIACQLNSFGDTKV